MREQAMQMVMGIVIGAMVLGILGLVGAEDHNEARRAAEEHRQWQTPTMRAGMDDSGMGWAEED